MAITPEYLPAPAPMNTLPFSEAVRVGDLLFLSGALGIKTGTMELVPGGVQAEARQMLENVKAALERAGSSMDRLVRCTVYLADMSEWAAFNEVYVTFFAAGRLPARAALGASGLAMGARVEIECTAVVGAVA